MAAHINTLWPGVKCEISCRVVAKVFGTLQRGEIALSVERISVAAFYPFLREGGKISTPKTLYWFFFLMRVDGRSAETVRCCVVVFCDLVEMNTIFIGFLVHPITGHQVPQGDKGIALLFL